MHVNIAAKSFDLSGYIGIDTLPTKDRSTIQRRSTKVAVLDGGVAVNDGFFSHGDRDLEFRYTPVSSAHDDTARRIVELHTRVYVTTPEGCFEAIPGPFISEADENTFFCQIIQKVSED